MPGRVFYHLAAATIFEISFSRINNFTLNALMRFGSTYGKGFNDENIISSKDKSFKTFIFAGIKGTTVIS